MDAGFNAKSGWDYTPGAPDDPRTRTNCTLALNDAVPFDWPKLCTIVMHESDSNFRTPGNSQPSPPTSYGNPASIDLSDAIVGGTGRFAGASGSASGQVKIAGGTAIINLSGTVTF